MSDRLASSAEVAVATGADVPGLLLHPNDEVVVLLTAASVGDAIVVGECERLTSLSSIPAGHKVARTALAGGALIHKYGQPIGRLTSSVERGEHVHCHNLVSLRAVGGAR
ncbi:MAG TPA: UxaA family hydrolase [Ilumatobacteraceae bacterium]|nr:UxaA family hydrolase [Ilumatobacteraceae bacterium]